MQEADLPHAWCLNCQRELTARKGRGRRPRYCGTACRQAAYRKREKRTEEPAGPDEVMDQALRELAADAQEEVRHLIRLLSPHDRDTVIQSLQTVVRLRRQVDTLTAGVVGQARRRKVSWETIGNLLAVSPGTARRQFREGAIDRRLQRRPQPVPPRAAPSQAGGGSRDPAQSLPKLARSSRRAGNQLAPVLSHLQRASDASLRQLGRGIGVSSSYVSRILSGEKFPSWELTERFARACGADPMPLLRVWENEKLRQGRGSATYEPPPLLPGPGRTIQEIACMEPLHDALGSLHRRAGSPSPRAIAVVAGLTEEEILSLLEGAHVPCWDHVHTLVTVLDGSPEYFRQLWEFAAQAADHSDPAQPLPATAVEPRPGSEEPTEESTDEPTDEPANGQGASGGERLDELLVRFGQALMAGPEELFTRGPDSAERTREQAADHHQARFDAMVKARLGRLLLPRLGT